MFYYILSIFISLSIQDYPPFQQANFPEISDAQYWTIAKQQSENFVTDSFILIIMRPPDCLQCDIHSVLVNEVYEELLGKSYKLTLPVYQHSTLDSNITQTLKSQKYQDQGFTVLVQAGKGVDYYDYKFLEQETLIDEQWQAQKERMEKFLRINGRLSSYEVHTWEDILGRHKNHSNSNYSILYLRNELPHNIEQFRIYLKAIKAEDQLLSMHLLGDDLQAVVDHFKIDEDSCFLVLNGSSHEDIQCPNTLTDRFIVEVVKTFTYEPILQLWNSRSLRRIRYYQDTTLIVFMKENVQIIQQYERLAHQKIMEKLYQTFNGRLVIAYHMVGQQDFDEALQLAQINKDEKHPYPIVVILNMRSDRQTYYYEGLFDYAPINTFVRNYLRAELTQHYMSQAIPSENSVGAFKEVVGQTFKELIILSNRTALLYQYQDRSCEKCKKIEENITQATQQFLGLVDLFSINSNLNKSPYSPNFGAPRLILYVDQGEYANYTTAKLEATRLINKLYQPFNGQDFTIEQITQWLYSQIFRLKMEMGGHDGTKTSYSADL